MSEWNKYILTIVFSNAGSINILDHFYQIWSSSCDGPTSETL